MNYDEKTLQYKTLLEAQLGLLLSAQSGIESRVLEAMRYSVLSGGKRVRGILTMATCEMLSGQYEEAGVAAAAIEMVHAYSLVHDDLPAMDDDDTRRGKPACHIAFDEATAILAGDGLLTLAFESLTKISDAVQSRDCVAALAMAGGHRGMVLGQELDLAAEGNTLLTPAQLHQIHQYKTGALIRAALGMGAILGGATRAQQNAADEYGALIGQVFQLVDDMLDVTADERELGKPVGSDAGQGKITGVTQYGMEQARSVAQNLNEKAVFILTSSFDNNDYLVEFTNRLLTRTK